MNFFRIGRSLWRNTLHHGGGRSAMLNEGLLQTPHLATCPRGFDGKLGFFREYLVSVGAPEQFAAKTDVHHILANPEVHRFFSCKALKETRGHHEDFCPQEKMEIPKGDDQKSDYKDTSDRKNRRIIFDICSLILLGLLLTPVVSFELKEPLEPGSVAGINVIHEPVVRVVARHLWSGSAATDRRLPGYYFFVTTESFEKKLKEAQEALGTDPHDRTPNVSIFLPNVGLVLILILCCGLPRLLLGV